MSLIATVDAIVCRTNSIKLVSSNLWFHHPIQMHYLLLGRILSSLIEDPKCCEEQTRCALSNRLLESGRRSHRRLVRS